MATITTAELATELGTDGRTLRKFLRSVTPKADQPGKGSKWAIEKKSVRSLRTQFSKWTTAQDEKKSSSDQVADTEVDENETEVMHNEVGDGAGNPTS